MSRITAAIWITSISTPSSMVMSPGWPIGRIPPSIVMWRAASIRQIGAGRWMGGWGDWSKSLKGSFRRKRPITRSSDYASLIEPTALMARSKLSQVSEEEGKQGVMESKLAK